MLDSVENSESHASLGFTTAVKIIPYLVAMLVAIGLLRASGVLGLVLDALRALVGGFGFDARWVDAVPVMLLKPLSGSGARGMMIETMQAHGVDSFAGRLACIVQGSTETTFYVLAVYFGSVGVRITRHALACALIADGARLPDLLVDQGGADNFLGEQLKTHLLTEACAKAGIPATIRMQPGYDHSYYFISSFMAEHVGWHAARLKA